MGYYLTGDLVQAVADHLAPSLEGLVEPGTGVSIMIADLSCRADWDADGMVEAADGESPLVLFSGTFGEASLDAQAEGAKLAETALLMMDREGVPLESLFGSLRQNLEEGDLYPSTEVVGLLAGHLAVAVGGQDKATNTEVCQQFLDGILESVYAELAYDDETTPSSFVGDETQLDETPLHNATPG